MAANISKQHYRIMLQKVAIIKELEEQLDIPTYQMRKSIMPVQMVMFIIFGISAIVFTIIFVDQFKMFAWNYRYVIVIIAIIAFVIYYFIPVTKVKNKSNSSIRVPFLVVRKKKSKSDWKLEVEPRENNNGRKILVNKLYPRKEHHAETTEWKSGAKGDTTAVVETGYGGVEISTFTEKANQDRHKHLIATETYIVLAGEMKMKIEEYIISVYEGDEIIIFPNTVHEILNNQSPFLTRVHTINCYGEADKYIEFNGNWRSIKDMKNGNL